MILALVYNRDAIPGKPLKRKLTDAEVKARQQEYEEKCKTRSINPEWKVGRPWLLILGVFFSVQQILLGCRTKCPTDRKIISPGLQHSLKSADL